ncbi:hypothetical protein [Ketobacter alkanivorans]|uniref:Uncharacterized protein n=1 Tax=Ketobacter alkanivorans TaxID=1917421 RepID=A0A2K9LM45_9GAMM|nr:hypothetical protein [Ketobacter alkanivorans]AUM13426.1 hypothetical protein Kalk_13785 [Ketobacter alkanivorans]
MRLQKPFTLHTIVGLLVLAVSIHSQALPPQPNVCQQPPSRSALIRIGDWIYRNECNRQRQCLVDWNQGESFPSLGIGHFIWYPANLDQGYTESFPQLIQYLRSRNAPIPKWLERLHPFDAPWPNRNEFIGSANSENIEILRQFLEQHTAEQTEFMMQRLQLALPRLVEHTAPPQRRTLLQKLDALCNTSRGWYGLIDYVNFKGEGLTAGETYQGQGWGLLQVLQNMDESSSPNDAFAQSAANILTRRAALAPKPIEQQKWLPGWLKRVNSYRGEAMLD